MKSKIEWTEKLISRFWANVKKSETCWLWQAGLFSNGYGQFRVGRKKMKAHRVSYMITNNIDEIPDGKIICHKCDTPRCVNPSHLILETHQFNMRDRDLKGRQAKGNGTRGSKGEKNPAAKLTESIVKNIIDDLKRCTPLSQCSIKYNISKSTISAIKRGVIWQQIAR